MSCLKILVFTIIAQCRGHHIYLPKGLKVQHDDIPIYLAYIHGKWTPVEIETKSGIQKRESVSEGDMPLKVEIPAPVIEHVEEKENTDVPSVFGFQPPKAELNNEGRVPLTRSIVGLNTDIRELLPVALVPIQRAGEIYGALPPIEPITTEHVAIIPPPNPEPKEPPPPPRLFDRTRVRQYAVYAGDVILKYLSQFFNRARITYNRITSPPPPPEPVYAD